MSTSTPLRTPRLVALFLAWAWAVVSLGVEINAFVKSHRDKRNIKSLVQPPTTVSINDNDVFRAGEVVTAVSAMIIILCTLFLGFLAVDRTSRSRADSGISTRTLPLQYLTLGFLALWLFATQVAVTVFVARRSPKITAFLDGQVVPSSVVQAIEQTLGVRTRYKDYHYLKLIAILPWFAFLFTLIAAIVSFVASLRSNRVDAETERAPTEKKTAA